MKKELNWDAFNQVKGEAIQWYEELQKIQEGFRSGPGKLPKPEELESFLTEKLQLSPCSEAQTSTPQVASTESPGEKHD